MVPQTSYPAIDSREFSRPFDDEIYPPRCEICGAQAGVTGVHNIHGHWFSILAICEVAGGFAFDEHGPRYRAHFGDALPEPTVLVESRCQWCRKGGA